MFKNCILHFEKTLKKVYFIRIKHTIMKVNFKNILLAVIFICLLQTKLSAQFYIAANGNDNNPGTKELPLASLTGARNTIRTYRTTNGLAAPITVIVKEGKYEMTEPFLLFPEDGGTKEFPIIYRAEKDAKPVFSGGKTITGFRVNKNGIWELKIPECAYYGWRFDQLYVNSKRAIMARTPNSGYLTIKDIEQHVWKKGTGRSAEKAEQILSFDKQSFQTLLDINDNELANFRFRTYHHWDFTLRFVDKIEKDSFLIYTSGQGMKPWNPIKKGGRIIFENYAAALDSAGEWYLNPEGILFYKPRPGEKPENSEVTVPVLQNLLTVKGDALNNKFVENIRFEGLSFKYSHYRIKQSGFEPNQAAISVNAAVMLEGAKNISFTDCEVSKTGQHALWFGKGCSFCSAEHCYLKDLGGGGVYLGDLSGKAGAGHTSNIRLHNNIIQTGGREFPPAVGIWVGHSSDNDISHNDISDFYYTGISVGWVWGYKPSLAKRNIITNNQIHHIGWDLLSDMAAIYTLGKSEGTKINNNVIHHIHAYSYGGWGLYPDEGTSDIVMENNLVYSTKTGGFHQHYGKNNLIRNNILAYAKLYQAQCTRVEKHLSFTFEKNIIVFDEGVVLKGAWDKIKIKMDDNLYWNTAGGGYDFNGKSFEKWKKTGRDTNSLIADPHFKDPENFNFNFTDSLNINKINFKPFDYSKAGVYGNDYWINKALLPQATLEAFDKAVEANIKKNIKRN